jgi:hypothetical protein
MSTWRDQAACHGGEARLWFVSSHDDPVAAATAARICGSCPVRSECAGEAERLRRAGITVCGTWAGVYWSG